MTTIYYENWPVARLADQDALSLTYDAAWEKRASAFPLSLTMPLRVGSHGPKQSCHGSPTSCRKSTSRRSASN